MVWVQEGLSIVMIIDTYELENAEQLWNDCLRKIANISDYSLVKEKRKEGPSRDQISLLRHYEKRKELIQ